MTDVKWSREFEIRHYEIDSGGRLSIPYLCRMLQEGAGRHADQLQIARDRLVEFNLTWILSRFHLKVEKPEALPCWKDSITIQTWRAKLERIFATRDYRVINPKGEVLAVATSSWAIMDTQKRRVVPIPSFVVDDHPRSGERALESDYSKLPALERFDTKMTFRVDSNHVDQNDHTNNVSYITWLMETLQSGPCRDKNLVELEVLFRAECARGDELAGVAQKEGEGQWLHQILRSKDEREVVQARTRWL